MIAVRHFIQEVRIRENEPNAPLRLSCFENKPKKRFQVSQFLRALEAP